MASSDLRSRARAAYERGRWVRGLRAGAFALPATAVSFAACGGVPSHLLMGAVLFVVATAFSWRGGPIAKGVVPGFIAGAVPLLLPLSLRSAGVVCVGGSCVSICLLACFGGGIVAGAAIAFVAARLGEGQRPFFAAASTIAGLTGGLGCVLAGFGGIVGLAAGAAVAATPVLVLNRARS